LRTETNTQAFSPRATSWLPAVLSQQAGADEGEES
jgi:hypothetical protein